MHTQIYYFSGTGNSLHVARELKHRLGDTTLIPIVSAMRSVQLKSTAETVGLVFPIHAFSIPRIIQQFLQRINLRSASFLFAITTRLCSDKAFSDLDQILASQARTLHASFSVEMACTYTPMFGIPSQDEIQNMESGLQERLDTIQAIVANKQPSREKDDASVYMLGHVIYPPITAWFRKVRFPDMVRAFYADDRCLSCGTCERICLSERIKRPGYKPQWNDEQTCTLCFACLHWCPRQAIQIKGRNTARRGRYHHPAITADDIARQKCWGQ